MKVAMRGKIEKMRIMTTAGMTKSERAWRSNHSDHRPPRRVAAASIAIAAAAGPSPGRRLVVAPSPVATISGLDARSQSWSWRDGLQASW